MVNELQNSVVKKLRTPLTESSLDVCTQGSQKYFVYEVEFSLINAANAYLAPALTRKEITEQTNYRVVDFAHE